MAQVVQRFNVAAGKPYQTRDGQDKKQWINAGRAVQWDDGGISIELTAVPVGNWWDGKLSLFVQEEKQQGGNNGGGQRQQAPQQRQAPQQSSGGNYNDEEIPFN
jgi:hypothetical protein